jgi:hypothetical protein
VAADPGRRRRHRGRDAARGPRAARRRRLVIVDEEHEAAYKSDRTPRLQARDARSARRAGRRRGRPRSATPAVDSVGGPRRALSPRRPADAPTGEPPASRSSTSARSSRPATAGLLSGASRGARALDTAARRAGDPRHQPARHGVGRPVPRLRPRPGVPGLRAAARLPPGRRHAPLPPLRPGDAARVALPALRSPRIRYLGGGTERVEREVRERSRASAVSPGLVPRRRRSGARPRSGSSTRSPRASSTSSS